MSSRTVYFIPNQRGAAAVEFAMVTILFFSLLFGVMEMGRMLFYWNTATEATRMGARIAVVCDADEETGTYIRTRMNSLLPVLSPEKVEILYRPEGCSGGGIKCTGVTVRVLPISVSTMIPFIPVTFNMPSFATTLPGESMESMSNEGDLNPVCSA